MSLLSTVNGRGLLSARPAAAAANEAYNYYATDTGILYRSNGSSWDTNSAGLANPMTTSQDIIVGGSSGTPGRLAKGADGTFLGVVSGSLAYATPSGGGGGALGSLSYDSGSDAVWKTTSSAVSADLDATNASLAITVPASGIILVMIQGMMQNTVTAGYMYWDVRTGSTVIGSAWVDGHVNGLPFASNFTSNQPVWIRCSGLTAGSLTIKAGFRISAGTMNVYAHDATGASGHLLGPFVMTAFAA